MSVYVFVGNRRSGHHAIVNWFCRSLPGRTVHLNNCGLSSSKKDKNKNVIISSKRTFYVDGETNFVFPIPEREQKNISKINGVDDIDNFVINLEKHSLDQINDFDFLKVDCIKKNLQYNESVKFILILRDIYNLTASRLSSFRFGTAIKQKHQCSEDGKILWEEYAKYFLKLNVKMNDVGFYNILFNSWFSDVGYRKKIHNDFFDTEFTDRGISDVIPYGEGSSFDGLSYDGKAQEMKVLDRWKDMIHDDTYNGMINESMVFLNRCIFQIPEGHPHNEGKKILFIKSIQENNFVYDFGKVNFLWVGYCRHIVNSMEYDEVIVFDWKDREFLYKDFCDKFICDREDLENIHYTDRLDYSNIPYNSCFVNEKLDDTFFSQQEFIKLGNYRNDLKYDVIVHGRYREDDVMRKNFDGEKFNYLLRRIKQQGYTVAVIGLSSQTVDMEDGLADDLRDIPLSELSDLLRSSRVIVGGDSGPLNFASLCGCGRIVWAIDFVERYLDHWNPFGVYTDILKYDTVNDCDVDDVLKSINLAINKKPLNIYLVYGSKRSGHHAVLNWFAFNLEGTTIHLNDVDFSNPNKDFMFNKYKIYSNGTSNTYPYDYFKDVFYKRTLGVKFDNLIISLEDKPLSDIPPERLMRNLVIKHLSRCGDISVQNIAVIRSYMNWKASIIKHGIEAEDREGVLKDYYISYLKSRDIKNYFNFILFDRWFSDKEYRDQFMNGFSLSNDNDESKEMIPTYANGSSFDLLSFNGEASEMDVLNRYKHFEKDEEFIKGLHRKCMFLSSKIDWENEEVSEFRNRSIIKDLNLKSNIDLKKNIKSFVLFFGNSRSGTTFLASIIDAHPNAIITREVDILKGFENTGIVDLNRITNRFESNKYRKSFFISEWSNSNIDENICVIGDKTSKSSTRVYRRGGLIFLKDFQKEIDLPLKFIHIIRNPFDVVCKVISRGLIERHFSIEELEKDSSIKDEIINQMRLSFHSSYEVKKKVASDDSMDFYDIYLEDIIKDYRKEIADIYRWLNLDIDMDFIEKIGSSMRNPVRRREELNWSEREKGLVNDIISEFDFLSRYSFDSN